MTKPFFGETGPTATPPVTGSIPVQLGDGRPESVQPSDTPGAQAEETADELGDHPASSVTRQIRRTDPATSGEHRAVPLRRVPPVRSQHPIAADSSPVRFDDASVRRVFFRGARASA